MEEKVKEFIREIYFLLKNKLRYESDELPFFISIFISLFFFIIGINIFLEIAEELAEDNLVKFDNKISSFFINLRNEELTTRVILITNLGHYYTYIGLSIFLALLLIIRLKSWKFILQIFSVNILALLFNFFLKSFYGRDRPSAEHLVEASYLSFPSGHAMSAAAFYGFLIYLIIRYIKSLWIKIPLTLFCGFLILLIGISRIYLGVHYPSDVLAGFVGGFFWVTFCIIIFNILGLIRKRRQNPTR